MARRRHCRLTPLDVYDAYPSSDMLGVDRPHPLTGWRDFRTDDCGDTLFTFLIRELGDESYLQIDDQIDRLDAAIRDVLAVRFAAEAIRDRVQE